MEIILIENVDNLGLRGDTVKVKDGYARNFLIPKKMAIEATEGNKKQINQQRKKIESQKVKDRSEADVFKGILEGLQLTVSRKVGEQGVLYGSVTMQDLSNLIAEKGHKIDKRKISVDQVIKTPGDYNVSIRIHPEVKAVIKLTVYSEEQWEEMEAQKNAAAAVAAEAAVVAEAAAAEPVPVEETKVEAVAEEPVETVSEAQPEPKEGE
jgi:large subunit ribosomal protein L9